MDDYEDYLSLVDPNGAADGRSFYASVPHFLEILDRVDARATFFAIGRDASHPEHRATLREIAARGHEVGNHSHTHPYHFGALSRARKFEEIASCEAAIADALGERPVGFRAPSGDVDPETLEILAERGYLYDSSLIPSPLMWLFVLYGKLFIERADYRLGRPAYALAPPYPYLPRADALHRPRPEGAEDGLPLAEIPLSAVRWLGVPFYATLLRKLGPRGFDTLARLHPRRRPLHMGFHALDLADVDGTSLGAALARRPGLSVALARRERFVSHVFERMTQLGESVPLREIARDLLERCGSRDAA